MSHRVDYGASNGGWLKALEKAYGQSIYDDSTFGRHTPYENINSGNTLSEGIKVLSGSDRNTDNFWNTKDSTTRTKLTTAFANNKLVTVGTKSGDDADKHVDGIVRKHAYSILEWDAIGDRVKVRNPHGYNPTFDQGGDRKNFLGKTDAENPTRINNGVFWMPLTILTKEFTQICYEE